MPITKEGDEKAMSIRYDKLFTMLKDKGVSTYKIRKDKVISESALQSLRQGKSVTIDTISALCALLNCQPGDIMEYVDDSADNATQDTPNDNQ
jgi:putative transcriptional regulator